MPRGAAVIPYDGKRGRVWRIKYSDAAGKQVMETIGSERDGVTRKQAEGELRDRLVKVQKGAWRKPASLTFADYARTWFAEGPKRRQWKPATVRAYVFVQGRLVEAFGPMPLAAIRPRHVAEFVASSKGGASTVGRDLAILHAIYDSARREELVDSNPAERIERPKRARRRWRILEPVEIGRVSRELGDQDRAVFLTLVLTGVRREELRALRWRDVDLVENVLRVRDSKTEDGIRSIALPSRLAEELWQHRRGSAFNGGDELVFCHQERGTPLETKAWKERFDVALVAAGVEGYVRPFHDLRHTAITNDAASGSSAIAVMTKAGHADMRTTQVYLHLAGVVFRDEAERLEQRLLGVESSTHLSGSEPTSADLNPLAEPIATRAD